MQALLDLTTALLRCTLAFFRSRNAQAIVELALRQQLATYAQKRSKPRLTPLDRALPLWAALSRFWPRWKEVLVIVKPDTIEARPSPDARIVGLPRVGGLHHRYAWQEAA